jgi:alkylhydroperoxidase/carboxymuconolactone decarboxylase family protein YurZ
MTKKLNPVQFVTQYNADAAASFQQLRKAVMAGPLDEHVCELIVIGALATTGEEGSFKVHARRLRIMGAPAEELRQSVLVTLGASTTFSSIVSALRWVDDVYSEEV